MPEAMSFTDGYRLIDGTALNDKFGFPNWSYTSAFVATPGGTVTTSAKIVTTMTDVTTASAPNAGVVLPQALPGQVLLLINSSANDIRVFAADGSTINGTPGSTGIVHKANVSSFYVSTDVNSWTQAWLDYSAAAEYWAIQAAASAAAAAASAANASASEIAAANDATAAAGSAASAAYYAAQAQTAANNAFVNANVYASVAAGLAATTVGQQFQVLDYDEYVRYRHDAGPIATEIARYPSALAVEALQYAPPGHPVFPDVDLIFGITDIDGGLLFSSDTTGASAIAGTNIFPDNGYVFVIVDTTGGVLSGIRSNYTTSPFGDYVSFVDTDLWLSGPAGNYKIATPSGSILGSEVNGGQLLWVEKVGASYNRHQFLLSGWLPTTGITSAVICPYYGQSLTTGTSDPPITQFPFSTTRAFMFNGGTMLGNNVGYTTEAQTLYFEPCKEQPIWNQTPVSGTLSWLVGASGFASTVATWGGSFGWGGQTITQLSKGTINYSNLIFGSSRAFASASVTGLPTTLPYILFDQGENNFTTPVATYKTLLLQLQTDITTDLNAFTGASAQIPLICWQPVSWTAPLFGGLTEGYSPLAILDAALSNPTRIKVVGPQYFSPYFLPLDIHPSAAGNLVFGQYMGRAAARVSAGLDTGALYVTAASAVGTTTITITFNKNAVIDTTLVTDPGQYGLRVFNSSTSATRTLSGFSLVGSTLTATLSAGITGANWYLGVADVGVAGQYPGPTTGPRSNFRDNSADLDAFGNNMYNWACVQQIAITT